MITLGLDKKKTFFTYSDSINCEKKQLLWLDHVEKRLKVKKNVIEDLLFCDAKVDVVIIRMRAVVNDSIHIQIQVVEFWNLKKKMKWKKMTFMIFWVSFKRCVMFGMDENLNHTESYYKIFYKMLLKLSKLSSIFYIIVYLILPHKF